jgi:hypothetical protein
MFVKHRLLFGGQQYEKCWKIKCLRKYLENEVLKEISGSEH